MADQALGGYDPNAGLSAHDAGRPQLIPVPSLLRALLSEHLDPGYAAAAAQRNRSGEPPTGRARAMSWVWQALAALLVASVFAAAVAQARLVAPGVSAAQRVLATGVRSEEATTGELTKHRNTLAAQRDDVQRHALAEDAAGQRLLANLDRLSLAAASTPVTGPGLSVTVTEPAVSPNLSDVSKQRVGRQPADHPRSGPAAGGQLVVGQRRRGYRRRRSPDRPERDHPAGRGRDSGRQQPDQQPVHGSGGRAAACDARRVRQQPGPTPATAPGDLIRRRRRTSAPRTISRCPPGRSEMSSSPNRLVRRSAE